MRGVFLILMLVSVAGCLPKKPKPNEDDKEKLGGAKPEQPKPKPKERLTDPVLIDDWAADWKNALAAESMYRGKIVTIVGSMAKVEKTLMGNPVLTIKGSRPFGAVRCEFAKDTPALLDLQELQAVVVAGECVGQSRLINCEIVRLGK